MQINFARREISCKIVFYGPGMSGKTTNLEVIHAKTPRENKGELTCIATEGDRTLFFDFMPLNLGNIMGMNTKFQLYTVPGQVYYNSTRKLVLRGVDGVIFVADSGKEKLEENIESLRNLEENLREYGRDIKELPVIIQFNKRDRADALDVETLNRSLNADKRPSFEAVATEGKGVFDCLKALAGLVIQNLNQDGLKTRPAARAEEPAAAAAESEDALEPAVGAASFGSGVATAARTAAAARTTAAAAKAAPPRTRRDSAPPPSPSSPVPPQAPRSVAPRTQPQRTVRPPAALSPFAPDAPTPYAPKPLRRRRRLSPATLVVALITLFGLAFAAFRIFFFKG